MHGTKASNIELFERYEPLFLCQGCITVEYVSVQNFLQISVIEVQ
jgi:hypothetical protein